MNGLRLVSRFWLHALLIAVLLLLVILVALPGGRAWSRVLNNTAHAPVFGALAWIILSAARQYPRTVQMTALKRYLLVLGAVMAIGVLTEAAQIIGPRDASLSDLATDLLGAGTVLGVLAAFDTQVLVRWPRARAILLTGAVLAALVVAAPLGVTGLAYVNRNQQFPTLVQTDTALQVALNRYFLRGDRARLTREEEDAGAVCGGGVRVSLRPRRWPGMHVAETPPDWSGYSTIAMDLCNPGEMPIDLTLHLRGDSASQQGTGRVMTFTLAPKTREKISTPLAEAAGGLSLKGIGSVYVFRTDGAHPAAERFVVHRIWLE